MEEMKTLTHGLGALLYLYIPLRVVGEELSLDTADDKKGTSVCGLIKGI